LSLENQIPRGEKLILGLKRGGGCMPKKKTKQQKEKGRRGCVWWPKKEAMCGKKMQ